MKKPSLNFMNRFEEAIFKNYAGSYTAVSSQVVLSTIIAAFSSIIVIFILQMFNADKSSATIVLSIVFALALLYCGYITYKVLPCLPTLGANIGLGDYVLVLFSLCSLLFIWIATWVVIIGLVLLVIWAVLKAVTYKKPGTATAYFSDGTTEQVEYDGKDILGNKTFKRSNGQTIQE